MSKETLATNPALALLEEMGGYDNIYGWWLGTERYSQTTKTIALALAVPTIFDEKKAEYIINSLGIEDLDEDAILAQIATVVYQPFVHHACDGIYDRKRPEYQYSSGATEYFRRYLRNNDPEMYTAVNDTIATYWTEKRSALLQSGEDLAEPHQIRRLSLRIAYHTIVVDEARGIQMLQEVVDRDCPESSEAWSNAHVALGICEARAEEGYLQSAEHQLLIERYRQQVTRFEEEYQASKEC